MNATVRVIFRGRVQGVNFRNSTYIRAMELGVTGWVRNLPDGTVEGTFSGDDHSVRELVKYCKSGIRRAVVEEATVEHLQFSPFDDFQIV